MATSRDANDPRDELRAMRKEAQAEFEREEAGDTGGSTHREPGREGVAAERRATDRLGGEDARDAASGGGEGEAPSGPERAAGLPVTPSPRPGSGG